MKRIADVQFISELMSVTLRGTIRARIQDSLDQVYADFEDLSEQPDFIEDNFRTSLEATKQYAIELSALRPKLIEFFKSQAHFYTFWGYLTGEKYRWLAAADFAPQHAFPR